MKTVYPLKLRFPRREGGGGGLKGRDISKLKQSEYQGADQTGVIHRQICAFSYS